MTSKINRFIDKLEAKDIPFQLIVEKGNGNKVSVAYKNRPCLCSYKYATFDLKKDKKVKQGIRKPSKNKDSFDNLSFSSEAVSLISSFEIINSTKGEL